MPTIKIQVKNKIAISPAERIVCGNSDYQIEFQFDDEWAAHSVKTARFVFNGQHEDVPFSGNVCHAPVIRGATMCAVGVYAGDLQTTTPALVSCEKSILCEGGLPADPAPDVYAQIMEIVNGMVSDERIEQAVEDYMEENPVQSNAEWIDLGVVDDVMGEMDNILEDGHYRLWTDDPFCYSLVVERCGDTIGQTHWSSEEGRGHIYFRTGYFYDGELEWHEEWTPHVTQDWLNQYALKTHKHRQSMNADFETWIQTFREGQYQINVQAESKSYIVDQFVFNNKPISTIHVCQRYFEISEPWKVYARHGTTNGNYVLVDWGDWHEC